MIKLQEEFTDQDQFVDLVSLSPTETKIFKRIAQVSESFHYRSLTSFHFEVKLRALIIHAAKDLNFSGVGYAIFEHSYCNPAYWNLQANGGFQLKSDVKPADAIRDIYVQGNLYAFECATAMVIVFYKAVLDAVDEAHFNRLFNDILLWDWHYDKDLQLVTREVDQFVHGDVLYFKNPDVNPATMEWQGENVVFLENDLYYGHGFGIFNAQTFINTLNTHRKPGATRSAYLLPQATRLGFDYLAQFEAPLRADPSFLAHQLPESIFARVGSRMFFQT